MRWYNKKRHLFLDISLTLLHAQMIKPFPSYYEGSTLQKHVPSMLYEI